MAFCPNCGNQIPAGASACPTCAPAAAPQPPAGSYGAPAPYTVPPSYANPGAVPASTQVGGLTENVAGALAYVTFIPAILFLVVAPYNQNRFVRFHAFQCLFYWVALAVIGIGLAIIGVIPVIGLITLPLHLVVWLGSFVIWLVLVFKAYSGQKFKLPFIGDMAEQQANTV